MQWRGLSCQISFYINECETCIRWITWPQSTWPQSGKMDWFFLKSVGGTNWRLIVMIAFPIFQAIGYYSRLPLDFTVAQGTVVHGVPVNIIICWWGIMGWRLLMDSDFSWTLFSKWANSNGHFQRVNSRGHFLSMRIPLLGWIFVDIFLVNSSGHFLMLITNSANTVGQPTRGVRGQSPC